jgi:hypothetical protein
MAPRVIKLREPGEPTQEIEQDGFSQRKRPEIGRFLLQVDGQTKGSYVTAEAAEAAGQVIKEGHPIVRVSVWDTVDGVNTLIDLRVGSPK